jgi:hypothetical protein
MSAQEPPKAVLVDEFENIPCEDVKARTDNFLAELSTNAADAGVVVIAPSKNTQYTKRIIAAHMFSRRFDRSRINIRSSEQSSAHGTQFWRVPIGATAPDSIKFDEPTRDFSKAFVYGNSERDETAGICSTFSPEDFADLIMNNPSSKARLVIFGPNSSSPQLIANDELEMFQKYTALKRNQIQLYFVHRPNLQYAETEYWYIPPRKK